jgi:hypothetical protein
MSGSNSSSQLYAVADCKCPSPSICPVLTPVCLIPMGLPVPSVGPQIAECQRVLERSGLEYKVGRVWLRGVWL